MTLYTLVKILVISFSWSTILVNNTFKPSKAIGQATRMDLSMLSCLFKHRNVTIFMFGVGFSDAETFLHYLDELINNKACYTINIFLSKENKLVRWKGEKKAWNRLMVGTEKNGPHLGTDLILASDEQLSNFVDLTLQKGRSS